MSTICWIRHP